MNGWDIRTEGEADPPFLGSSWSDSLVNNFSQFLPRLPRGQRAEGSIFANGSAASEWGPPHATFSSGFLYNSFIFLFLLYDSKTEQLNSFPSSCSHTRRRATKNGREERFSFILSFGICPLTILIQEESIRLINSCWVSFSLFRNAGRFGFSLVFNIYIYLYIDLLALSSSVCGSLL